MASSRGPQVVHLPQSEEIDDLICLYCRCLFAHPKRLLCGHIFCMGCLTDLQCKSKDGKTFRCPTCRKRFSTLVRQLPGCTDLERRVKARRAQELAVCQEPECGNQVRSNCPDCPHCRSRLCPEHFSQHMELIRREHFNCLNQLIPKSDQVDALVCDTRRKIKQGNISLDQVKRTFQYYHQLLNEKEADVEKYFTNNKKNMENLESKCADYSHDISCLMQKMEELQNSQDNTCTRMTAARMWEEVQAAKRLIAASESLGQAPPDICIEPVLQKLTDSLRGLLDNLKPSVTHSGITVESLIDVTDPTQDDFRPQQACLWTKTDGYCLDHQGTNARVESVSRAGPSQRRLEDEVLLVATAKGEIVVLSLKSERLGTLVIDQDPQVTTDSCRLSPKADFLSVCPSQERLAVASRTSKIVYVCDMSGRTVNRIQRQHRGHLSGISLDRERLIVTDTGIMASQNSQGGSVDIYVGPNYEPCGHIPTDVADLSPIFPLTAVSAGPNYLVLTSNADGEPSILVFSGDPLELIDEFELPESHGCMCVDLNLRVYVSEHSGSSVSVYSRLGEPVGDISGIRAESCHCLAVSPTEPLRLVVSDMHSGRVFVLTLTSQRA